jgi:hypothetical protein
VGDAELRAGLVADELGELGVTDAGGAVVVDLDGEGQLAQVGGGEGRDSAAEGVAGGDDAVVRVRGGGGGDGSGGGLFNLLPGLVEAGVDEAAGDEVVAGGEGEDNVGDEVADVVAATDGEDDVLAGVVDGDETTNAGEEAPAGGSALFWKNQDGVGLTGKTRKR